MIKKTNTRITITISKKQYNWLESMSKKLNLKMSKLIAWLLWTKSKDVEHTNKLMDQPIEEIERQEDETMTDEEINEFIKDMENRRAKNNEKYSHHNIYINESR